MTRVLGLVLAAGSGTRMGQPKATLVVEGERLLDRATATLRAGGCDDVAAVVPVGLRPAQGVLAVENLDAATGMRSSLVVGLTVAQGYDALAVTLVDTMGVTAEAVRLVVDRWRSHPDRIAVAMYDGRRAHPAVMTVARWTAAAALAGPDEGARAYLRAHPDDVDEVPAPGDATDLDTPDDLARWLDRR